jgi:hypothetical protein
MPPPASEDSPVPRMNRNSTGWTRDVSALSRSEENLISSRRHTTPMALRSCLRPSAGTATLIESTTAESAAGVTVSVTIVISSLA